MLVRRMDLSLSSSMEEESRLLSNALHSQCPEDQRTGKFSGYLDSEQAAASQASENSFAEALLFAQVMTSFCYHFAIL